MCSPEAINGQWANTQRECPTGWFCGSEGVCSHSTECGIKVTKQYWIGGTANVCAQDKCSEGWGVALAANNDFMCINGWQTPLKVCSGIPGDYVLDDTSENCIKRQCNCRWGHFGGWRCPECPGGTICNGRGQCISNNNCSLKTSPLTGKESGKLADCCARWCSVNEDCAGVGKRPGDTSIPVSCVSGHCGPSSRLFRCDSYWP